MTKTRDLADLVNGVTDADIAANAAVSSTKLAFTQSGTGAVQRSVDSKLKDVVSVKDFGAVGDGTTDDTAAIQAVLNNNDYVVFPPGFYAVTSLTFNRDGQQVDFNNAYLHLKTLPEFSDAVDC